MNTKYTDEFLISEFWRFTKENGRYPLSTDFKNNKDYPSKVSYERRFGSWKNFMSQLGIIGEGGWYKCDEDLVKKFYLQKDMESIRKGLMIKRSDGVIKKYANKIGLLRVKPINIDKELFIQDYSKNKLSILELSKKYSCTTSSIHKYISDNNISLNTRRWTKNHLEYLKENYGHEDWDMILKNLYPFDKEAIVAKAYQMKIKRDCFGWNEEELSLLIENYGNVTFEYICNLLPNKTESSIMTKANRLGLSMREKWSSDDIEEFKKLYPITSIVDLCNKYKRTESSIASLACNLGLKRSEEYSKLNKENKKPILIKELVNFAKELGSTPTSREVSANKEMAGILTYHRYFGSYANACREAGLEINQMLFGESVSIYYSLNNDPCFSRKEKVITDYMIENKINYKKEVEYYDITQDERFGLKRCDWYLGNNVFVEYFGMPEKEYYAKRILEKIKLCKENNLLLIELYPEDTNNNYQGVKEKLQQFIN